MKNDKILLILIITIIICIGGVLGIMLIINNNAKEDDEIRNLQEGGAEFTTDELESIDIEIDNLDSNIKGKIQYNKFIMSIKEYIYKNGLIPTTKLECITTKQEENKITIEFRLNNPSKTIVTAKINIKDYTYEFSDNY